MPVQKNNPFQSRNKFYKSRRRLNNHHHGSRRRTYHDQGYNSVNTSLHRFIRLFGAFLTIIGIVVLCYSKQEWVILFLNGPKIDKGINISNGNGYLSSLEDTSNYRPPEIPRPTRTQIFHALTQNQQELLEEKKQTFEHLKQSNQLISCQLDQGCFGNKKSSLGSSFFLRSRNPLIVLYNPLPEDRFWCGKRIWGNGGTIEITDGIPSSCKDNQELLPYVHSNRPPSIHSPGKDNEKAVKGGGPSVELFWNSNEYIERGTGDSTTTFPCSVPCKSTGPFSVINTINVRNTKWEITLSMEGEKYYTEAHVRAGGYREEHFYATTSFQSEIPVPYFSWAEYNIQHPAVDFNKAIKGASFLANNCDSLSKREELVEKLIKTTSLRIDALSSCLHNAESPPGIDMENKTDIMKEYLFHFAFENQRADDYITEKLWGALASGTLPIYFGAPNIKEHVPANSIINVDDYNSPQDLANYLIQLTKDKKLYESYHQWRYQPIDKNFAQKYAFTKTHSTCRMCKWAFAMQHGLNWNHTKQEIDEPFISHKTCRNKAGLVGHPFKEYWLSVVGETSKAVHIESKDATKTCKLGLHNRIIDIDHGILQRTVYDHDGITDLIIKSKGAATSYILKLETPIVSNQFFNLDDNIRWLQDSQSRMTILTSKNVSLSLIKQGTIQVPIASDIKVRIIVENVDHFHRGTRKIPTYFGDLMTRDFFSPIEAYQSYG